MEQCALNSEFYQFKTGGGDALKFFQRCSTVLMRRLLRDWELCNSLEFALLFRTPLRPYFAMEGMT